MGGDVVKPYAAIDWAELLERIDGDTTLLGDIVAMFLDDCPTRLAAIETAVEQADPEQIRMAAHALKGAAAVMAARPLAEAAHALERTGAEKQVQTAREALGVLRTHLAALVDALTNMPHELRGDAELSW